MPPEERPSAAVLIAAALILAGMAGWLWLAVLAMPERGMPAPGVQLAP